MPIEKVLFGIYKYEKQTFIDKKYSMDCSYKETVSDPMRVG